MILVTGATGYIGSRLVRRLVEDGHQVRALAVSKDPLIDNLRNINCEVITGDILNKATLVPCLQGVDTVFHLAAVMVAHDPQAFHAINYEGTKNVVDAAMEAGVEHFVVISAAAATYKVRTTYGESKFQMEKLMKPNGTTNFTIIRPALLYGDGGSQELMIYLKNLKKFPLIIPMVGLGRARKRPVWVGDIVNGLALLVNKPISYGKVYNFTGGTELSMWEYTKLMCRTFGIHKPMVPIPVFLCYVIAFIWSKISDKPLLRRDLILGVVMDANNSYEEASKDIGYKPVNLYEKFRESFTEQQIEEVKL